LLNVHVHKPKTISARNKDFDGMTLIMYKVNYFYKKSQNILMGKDVNLIFCKAFLMEHNNFENFESNMYDDSWL
jgi:hypothetical protein